MNGFYLFMHNTALKLNALIIPRAGKFFFFSKLSESRRVNRRKRNDDKENE